MIAYTFRESFAKKTFMAFFILSTLLHLFFIFALNIDMVDGARAMVQVFGNDVDNARKVDIEKILIVIESGIATAAYSVGIFLSIFATANLVPSMLERGSIDLLVSKPLSRPLIFLGRYLGALAIVIFNITYLILGNWLILSLKTGFWYSPYLLSIPVVVATFAIMYALMSLVGVTTRSTGFTMTVPYAIIFLSPLLIERDRLYAISEGLYYLAQGLYHVLPKIVQIGRINQELVMGQSFGGWSPLWTSGLAGSVMLLGAILIFARKEF